MDTTTDARARLHRLRVHPELIGETRATAVRRSLADKSPAWRAVAADPFILTADKPDDDIPF
jgi:hypothetical protein